jgi:hypothetical protein
MMRGICPLCDEEVAVPEAAETVVDGRLTHRSCMLRLVLGGIGHLEDHVYWCRVRHDPDGGRTFRQSGIEVAAWVEEHGMEAAVLRG